MDLNKYIDHTLLKPDATKKMIDKLVDEAIEYNFASVCVNPIYVEYVSQRLENTDVKTCTVVGFPLGQNTTNAKVFEAQEAINNGAKEIDMVINISMLKDRKYEYVLAEINQIKSVCQSANLKVIVETCLLTEDEKIKICEIVLESDADFIKTSTGMSFGGADVEDIKMFSLILNDKKKIKASSGIKDLDFTLKLINAGASRLGTSSGIKIIEEYKSNI